MFDQELFVEQGEERWGPYHPVHGPIPLHRYRKHRKSRREHRADKVGELAAKLDIPRSAVSGETDIIVMASGVDARAPARPFVDPDPFHELTFANPLAARRAIADEIRLPLATLSAEDRAFIDRLLAETLSRPLIIAAVRERFPLGRKGGTGSC